MSINYLVTGGSGFLGTHLIKGLLRKYSGINIKVISRSENEMAALLSDCKVIPIVGDIQNVTTLDYALEDVDCVIHLAAMKHIDLCEQNPTEAINTNVIATMDLLNLFRGDTFLSMSSDKVAGATGCYGATKLLLEKLTLEQSLKRAGRYMIVRSGNIFGSTGSVIPKWIHQIKVENKITVTDLDSARFYISPNALVSYMIDILENGENGKIYIPNQEIVSLNTLAYAVISLFGNHGTEIEVVGLRDAEKTHERLFFKSEKNIVTNNKYETSNNKEGDITKVKRWLEEYV